MTPREVGRLFRVVIPLVREEDPSALDPDDAPLPRRDVGGLGSFIPVLNRVQRAVKLRDRSSAESGGQLSGLKKSSPRVYAPSCVPFRASFESGCSLVTVGLSAALTPALG